MKDVLLNIISNKSIAPSVFEMKLQGDISDVTNCGQFVNFKLSGLYLRRPISVCDYDKENNILTVIYKVVGKGTEQMSCMKEGESILTLTGLGNGYDTSVSGDSPILLGGGVGVPPMYNLAKKLISENKNVTVILGFNTKSEVFYEEEFKALGAKVIVCTADGSYGICGFVTNGMEMCDYTYFYTCGPMPMFKAINKVAKTDGQFSFEEKMGCGFGACMGCSCKTITGYKRICKDGPVLTREEILWEQI